MIRSFRPNKDTLLFNIKNIPLHLFNFIFIHLQKGGYTPYYIKNLRFFYILRMEFNQTIHWCFFNDFQFDAKFTGNFPQNGRVAVSQ